MEKTREWIKDVALIVGHSVKSGVGRGQAHDEEQPLVPEQPHISQVIHLATSRSEEPLPLPPDKSRQGGDIERLRFGAAVKAKQEKACCQ